MSTPQQNTTSKFNEFITKSVDTTFGTSFQPSRIFPGNWIDVDAEQENIRLQNESISKIFKTDELLWESCVVIFIDDTFIYKGFLGIVSPIWANLE